MVLLHESRKKSSQGTQAVNHFRPRARRARGRKWLLLEARGMNFFLLKCGKIIYAQVTHAEIAFIYRISN